LVNDGFCHRPAITLVGVELPVTQELTGHYLRHLYVSQLSNRADYF